MREDTSPETPLAKSSSDPPPAPDPWQRPTSRPGNSSHGALFGGMRTGGARFDWAVGSGKVRTFQASGPAGLALAIVVLIVVGAIISAFFVFAVGVGTALALGAGVAAALGLGVNTLRRRLTGARHHELRSRDS